MQNIPFWLQAVAALMLGAASMGFFAEKTDVSGLRTEMYQNFVQGSDMDKVNVRLDRLNDKLDGIYVLLRKR